jgi:hypothetical protein
VFDGNIGSTGGALMLSTASAKVRGCYFKNNLAPFYGAAVFAGGVAGVPGTNFLDLQGCTFQNDTSGFGFAKNNRRDELGDSYAVLEAEYSTIVHWGPNTYLNLTAREDLIYGHSIRAYNATMILVPADGQPDGGELALPPTFIGIGSTLVVERVNAKCDKFLLQEDSVEAVEPPTLNITSRTLTATKLFSTRGSRVIGSGGKIVSTKETWFVKDRKFSITSATFENRGSVYSYPFACSRPLIWLVIFNLTAFAFLGATSHSMTRRSTINQRRFG